MQQLAEFGSRLDEHRDNNSTAACSEHIQTRTWLSWPEPPQRAPFYNIKCGVMDAYYQYTCML